MEFFFLEKSLNFEPENKIYTITLKRILVESMAKAKRISAKGNPLIGNQRYDLYEAAFAAYNNAMRHHYYLEAVGLIGSLIEDRLESLYNEFNPNGDHSVKTVGSLLKGFRKCPSEKFNEVLAKIDIWRPQRNDAIHQLAKLLNPDFYKHYDSLKKTAEDGLKIFRELDKQYKAYVRLKEKMN